MHNYGMDEKDSQPTKKSSFKRLSFFRQPSTQPTVLTTHVINKEYDTETGNKIINNFMILKEIGRGMHGKVKLAQDLDTGELVAIKIVDKQSRRRQLGYSALRAKSTDDSTPYLESEQKIRREIAILKKCIHPHVVRLREVIDDPTSRKIYLALEYMEGGEIIWREDDESNTPVLTAEESRQIFRDVVSGLDYLHYQGIIHRDIKPANLLLTKDGIVKISDFGVSYFNQQLAGGTSLEIYNDEIDRELAETAGTPAFFAPELCSSVENNHVDDKRITKAIDVWALGVTLYCLIFGQCPFTASTEFELFDIIPTQPLVFPRKQNTPIELIDLLNKLLEKDPNLRITLDQVKHHPWVIQDLVDPASWWKESDPKLYKTVHVTDDDVSRAVTLMDKLRKSIHRISSSLSNTFSRHASKSSLNNSLPDINPSPTTSIIAHPQPTTLATRDNNNNGWLPTSFTPSTCSSSSKESIRIHDDDDDKRSSGSSMSGLVVTFTRASEQ
ncbi:kinase-like domain-containing protein [Thamnidium elegans]|uniref:non-specific serine/threonine protein kinase n=1 Tax=Thamnidium elegans TaxID=101142 RepID=A0A8H7VVK2_9FUNG|nr:hypothetical protein INT48_007608 [Thamnidium elegans]KAI8051816.1 kinase-like domain-containing protein [Thamnidium elegans]